MRSDFIAGQVIQVFVWQSLIRDFYTLHIRGTQVTVLNQSAAQSLLEKFEYSPHRSWEASEDGVLGALAGIGLGCHG